MDEKQLVTVANFILITYRYKMMSPFRCGVVATESTVRSDNQSTPDLDNMILLGHVGVHQFQAIWIMLHDFQPTQLLSIRVRYVKLSTYKRELCHKWHFVIRQAIALQESQALLVSIFQVILGHLYTKTPSSYSRMDIFIMLSISELRTKIAGTKEQI